jgi:hypothetical protein
MEMDGNILYFIEGSRELLPGYVETSKGNNTAKRNIPHTIKHKRPPRRDRSGEEGEVKDKAPTRTKTHQYSNTIGLMGQRSNIQGKGTNNNIRMPNAREII